MLDTGPDTYSEYSGSESSDSLVASNPIIKVLALDVDDTLLEIIGFSGTPVPIKNADLLLPILQFASNRGIKLAICTSRGALLDSDPTSNGGVTVKDLVKFLRASNIEIDDDYIFLCGDLQSTDHPEYKAYPDIFTQFRRFISQDPNHPISKMHNDKCFVLQRLAWQQHIEAKNNNQVGLLDDSHGHYRCAKQAGFSAIKATDPNDSNIDYLIELAERVGLTQFIEQIYESSGDGSLKEIAQRYLMALDNRRQGLQPKFVFPVGELSQTAIQTQAKQKYKPTQLFKHPVAEYGQPTNELISKIIVSNEFFYFIPTTNGYPVLTANWDLLHYQLTRRNQNGIGRSYFHKEIQDLISQAALDETYYAAVSDNHRVIDALNRLYSIYLHGTETVTQNKFKAGIWLAIMARHPLLTKQQRNYALKRLGEHYLKDVENPELALIYLKQAYEEADGGIRNDNAFKQMIIDAYSPLWNKNTKHYQKYRDEAQHWLQQYARFIDADPFGDALAELYGMSEKIEDQHKYVLHLLTTAANLARHGNKDGSGAVNRIQSALDVYRRWQRSEAEDQVLAETFDEEIAQLWELLTLDPSDAQTLFQLARRYEMGSGVAQDFHLATLLYLACENNLKINGLLFPVPQYDDDIMDLDESDVPLRIKQNGATHHRLRAMRNLTCLYYPPYESYNKLHGEKLAGITEYKPEETIPRLLRLAVQNADPLLTHFAWEKLANSYPQPRHGDSPEAREVGEMFMTYYAYAHFAHLAYERVIVPHAHKDYDRFLLTIARKYFQESVGHNSKIKNAYAKADIILDAMITDSPYSSEVRALRALVYFIGGRGVEKDYLRGLSSLEDEVLMMTTANDDESDSESDAEQTTMQRFLPALLAALYRQPGQRKLPNMKKLRDLHTIVRAATRGRAALDDALSEASTDSGGEGALIIEPADAYDETSMSVRSAIPENIIHKSQQRLMKLKEFLQGKDLALALQLYDLFYRKAATDDFQLDDSEFLKHKYPYYVAKAEDIVTLLAQNDLALLTEGQLAQLVSLCEILETINTAAGAIQQQSFHYDDSSKPFVALAQQYERLVANVDESRPLQQIYDYIQHRRRHEVKADCELNPYTHNVKPHPVEIFLKAEKQHRDHEFDYYDGKISDDMVDATTFYLLQNQERAQSHALKEYRGELNRARHDEGNWYNATIAYGSDKLLAKHQAQAEALWLKYKAMLQHPERFNLDGTNSNAFTKHNPSQPAEDNVSSHVVFRADFGLDPADTTVTSKAKTTTRNPLLSERTQVYFDILEAYRRELKYMVRIHQLECCAILQQAKEDLLLSDAGNVRGQYQELVAQQNQYREHLSRELAVDFATDTQEFNLAEQALTEDQQGPSVTKHRSRIRRPRAGAFSSSATHRGYQTIPDDQEGMIELASDDSDQEGDIEKAEPLRKRINKQQRKRNEQRIKQERKQQLKQRHELLRRLRKDTYAARQQAQFIQGMLDEIQFDAEHEEQFKARLQRLEDAPYFFIKYTGLKSRKTKTGRNQGFTGVCIPLNTHFLDCCERYGIKIGLATLRRFFMRHYKFGTGLSGFTGSMITLVTSGATTGGAKGYLTSEAVEGINRYNVSTVEQLWDDLWYQAGNWMGTLAGKINTEANDIETLEDNETRQTNLLIGESGLLMFFFVLIAAVLVTKLAHGYFKGPNKFSDKPHEVHEEDGYVIHNGKKYLVDPTAAFEILGPMLHEAEPALEDRLLSPDQEWLKRKTLYPSSGRSVAEVDKDRRQHDATTSKHSAEHDDIFGLIQPDELALDSTKTQRKDKGKELLDKTSKKRTVSPSESDTGSDKQAEDKHHTSMALETEREGVDETPEEEKDEEYDSRKQKQTGEVAGPSSHKAHRPAGDEDFDEFADTDTVTKLSSDQEKRQLQAKYQETLASEDSDAELLEHPESLPMRTMPSKSIPAIDFNALPPMVATASRPTIQPQAARITRPLQQHIAERYRKQMAHHGSLSSNPLAEARSRLRPVAKSTSSKPNPDHGEYLRFCKLNGMYDRLHEDGRSRLGKRHSNIWANRLDKVAIDTSANQHLSFRGVRGGHFKPTDDELTRLEQGSNASGSTASSSTIRRRRRPGSKDI